jgi:acyl-coenzyme A synthetase/AMP-(fatty) acid ligase
MGEVSLFEAAAGAPATGVLAASGQTWNLRQVLDAAEALAAELVRRRPAGHPVVAAATSLIGTALLTLAADLARLPVIHTEPGAPATTGGLLVSEVAASDRDGVATDHWPAAADRTGPVFAFGLANQPVAMTGVPANAQIFQTSGSTGLPSSVVRTAAAVLADAERVATRLDYGPGMPVVASAPAFHLYGHTYALIAPLISGAVVYHLGARTVPTQLARAACRTAARVLIAHPYQYWLLGHDEGGPAPEFGPVKVAVSAGAPLLAQTLRAIRDRHGFEMFNCYGSSEAGAVTLGPVTGWEPAGDVGPPLPGVTAEVDVQGELLLRTSSLAAGHLSPSGMTPLPQVNGTYRTGDLATLAGGRIRLGGRISNVINVAGKKVSPAEIERVIAEHPLVRDVQVSGEPDQGRGAVPVARVVTAAPLPSADLLTWCQERLAPHQVPRRFDFLTELPRSVTGKPVRATGQEPR